MAKYGNIMMPDRFWTDENYFYYKNIYRLGQRGRILKADIETASIIPLKMGKSRLEIVGRGTTLMTVDLPTPWAEGAQTFVLKEIGKIK
jgi:hypothetical protein